MKIREEIIQAYHGSPYQFNKFDMSKIGSGDGLNKYGYGLYFADREDTAEYYAKELTLNKYKETGFNIYEVRLDGDFYQWDYEIPDNIHFNVINGLREIGKDEDAEEMEREAEEYGDHWSMDSLYQWLEVVLGGQKNTSKFLVNCGVDGVIAQSPAHEGNVIVVYNDNAINITNIKKLGEGEDLTEMIRREIWTMNEDGSTGFNMEEFDSLPSFAARKRYADANLQKIGAGSARIVYRTSDGNVLKLAKNKKGIAQNEYECGMMNDYYIAPYITKISNCHPNNLWILVEEAKKLTPTRFKQLTGVSIDDLNTFLRNIYSQNNGRGKIFGMSPEVEEAMWENEFASGINDIMQNYGMPSGDLGRLSSYGEVIRDGQPEVVLVDYGLSDDVFTSYYARMGENYDEYFKEEPINEVSFQMQDFLDNAAEDGHIKDGGYASTAMMPQSIGESFEDYRNIDTAELKQSTDYIENFNSLLKPKEQDISKLYKNYLIGSQNIENSLKISNNNVNFFNKLMDVQKFLKKFGLIKEDLVYWGADDASPDSDEYKLGSEGISEGVNDGVNDAENVAVKDLKPFCEFDRRKEAEEGIGGAKEEIERLTKDIKENGIQTPLLLMWYENENKALLVKGNHRIVVAEDLGIDIVPVKVERNSGKAKEKAKKLNGVFNIDKDEKILPSKIGFNIKSNNLNEGNINEYIENINQKVEELGIDIDEFANKINSKDVSGENVGFRDDGTMAYYDIGYSKGKEISKFNRLQYESKKTTNEDGTSLYTNDQGTVNSGDVSWDLQEMVLDSLANVITERIKSWMPKVKAVSVKKNCKLGGKGDGTSDACNQGDINNLELKDIQDENSEKPNEPNVAEDNLEDRHYFKNIKRMIKEEIENSHNKETVLNAAKELNLRIIDADGKQFVGLWHGTSPANHKKIMKSGKFLSGSYFAKDEDTARRYGGMHISRGKPVVMSVFIDADKLFFDGNYFTTNQEVSDGKTSHGLYEDESDNVCETLEIPDYVENYLKKFESDEQLLRSGGLPDDILDQWAFGFTDKKNQIMPDQLIIRWRNDLENVKWEIKQKGLSDIEFAQSVDLSEPVDVDYDKPEGWSEGFILQDGHHRYYAAKILNKPLNMNLTIKINPTLKLSNMDYDKFHRCIWKQVNGVTQESSSTYNKDMIKEANIMSLQDLPFKQEIEKLGGKIYSVGGAVRDEFLGKDSKDLDILITGIPFENLEHLLQKYGKVDAVGKSFGVIKFVPRGSTDDIDIAIPRTEKKVGDGHQGFDVTSDHNLPIEADLKRRDFTINAIAKDIDGNLVDPYGGQKDLASKTIRVVNPEAFADDPLRMLRAVQFASRFGFEIEPKTMELIRRNAGKIKEIAGERMFIELEKILKKGDILYGVDLLKDTGLYKEMFGKDIDINRALPWNSVSTMGEFMYMLISPVSNNPAEVFRTTLKGDIPTVKEIEALTNGFNNVSDDHIKNRALAHNMFIKSPNSLNSSILPENLKNAIADLTSGKYPKTIKELAINGNDLMGIGLKGKEIGDTLKSLLINVYGDKVKNNREDLMNFLMDARS